MKTALNILALCIIIIISNTAFANTGVFYGAGNQVIPIKNNDIQLVREKVNIVLSVDKRNGRFGVPFIPWANVRAEFYLANTSEKEVNLQMGFPFLDLQGFGDEKYVLENIDFKVFSDDQELKAELKEGLIEKEFDPKGLFKKVFAWDESFGPRQTKTVIVTYKLLMGIASANSIMRDFDEVGRKYREIDKQFPAINYSFTYITKTAYTWKEPIEKAIFQFDASSFLRELISPDFSSSVDPDGATITKPIYLEKIYPSTYQKKDGIYEWQFTDKVPEEGLSINFVAVFIPSTPKDLKLFVDSRLAKLKGTAPDEYKSVLKHYYKYFAFTKEPTDPFLTGYFKGVWLVKEDNRLVFEKDQNNIEQIANDFNRLVE